MSANNLVQPSIRALSQEQMHLVHAQSLKILSSVGVRVDSERARRIFLQALGTASVDGERVFIPPEFVEQALETAPSSVEIFDRRGELAFRAGLDGTRFGVGVTALYYQDPETNQVVPFAREHMASMVRLGGVLPSFDFISTVGIVQDVTPDLSDEYGTLEMVANTVKPLMILVSNEARFDAVLDLIEGLHGDLAARPFIIPYFNPITPLVINAATADKLLVAVERGLPVVYSNLGMAGATAPITSAGMLAMLNAELLAGLTLSQLAKAGTPVILGSLPGFFDMQATGSGYDPLGLLVSLACAEMMAFYGLPHCGTSGGGGWGADLIAAGNQWSNQLLSCMGKTGLAPFVGTSLKGMAFCPANIVFGNAVIRDVRRLVQGFTLDEADFAADDVAAAGPGGHFLISDLTLERFRDAHYASDLWPNLTLEGWADRGRPRAEELVRQLTRELMAGLRPPDDHDDLIARGEAFIRSSRA
jgi:trimethylamine--corrinoid protein Co-methyltransferase